MNTKAINNRLTKTFKAGNKNLLNIYFTAGFPELDDTVKVLKALEKAGADMIEIGMPYSDPLADGPTIQASSSKALSNGMSIKKLFEQLEGFRNEVSVPVILMGYLNPVMQYGVEAFCKKAAEVGIDGLILPDLPINEYEDSYRTIFEQHNLSNIFLVTPQTSEERLRKIDCISDGFIYAVSTDSTTGGSKSIMDAKPYFERLKATNLKNPLMIGFNIKDHSTFSFACQYASGGIIGSAFIKALEKSTNLEKDVFDFVKMVKG
ncbi:tryptophan synthase subunit alpha [Cytophagaceae bacterium ABcell3]|nr:tryptophan synthase subunit alpha [Cytophagaceae bacterium ABcell3]